MLFGVMGMANATLQRLANQLRIKAAHRRVRCKRLDGAAATSILFFSKADHHIHKLAGFLKTQHYITESNWVNSLEPAYICQAPDEIASPKLLTFLNESHSVAQDPIPDAFVANELQPSDWTLQTQISHPRLRFSGWATTASRAQFTPASISH
jgi:hypothetical protein